MNPHTPMTAQEAVVLFNFYRDRAREAASKAANNPTDSIMGLFVSKRQHCEEEMKFNYMADEILERIPQLINAQLEASKVAAVTIMPVAKAISIKNEETIQESAPVNVDNTPDKIEEGQSIEEQVKETVETAPVTETPVIETKEEGASVSETKATLLAREKMVADVLSSITKEQTDVIAKLEMQRKRNEAIEFVGKTWPQLQYKRDRNQIVSTITFRRRQEDKENIKNTIRQAAAENGYRTEREPLMNVFSGKELLDRMEKWTINRNFNMALLCGVDDEKLVNPADLLKLNAIRYQVIKMNARAKECVYSLLQRDIDVLQAETVDQFLFDLTNAKNDPYRELNAAVKALLVYGQELGNYNKMRTNAETLVRLYSRECTGTEMQDIMGEQVEVPSFTSWNEKKCAHKVTTIINTLIGQGVLTDNEIKPVEHTEEKPVEAAEEAETKTETTEAKPKMSKAERKAARKAQNACAPAAISAEEQAEWDKAYAEADAAKELEKKQSAPVQVVETAESMNVPTNTGDKNPDTGSESTFEKAVEILKKSNNDFGMITLGSQKQAACFAFQHWVDPTTLADNDKHSYDEKRALFAKRERMKLILSLAGINWESFNVAKTNDLNGEVLLINNWETYICTKEGNFVNRHTGKAYKLEGSVLTAVKAEEKTPVVLNNEPGKTKVVEHPATTAVKNGQAQQQKSNNKKSKDTKSTASSTTGSESKHVSEPKTAVEQIIKKENVELVRKIEGGIEVILVQTKVNQGGKELYSITCPAYPQAKANGTTPEKAMQNFLCSWKGVENTAKKVKQEVETGKKSKLMNFPISSESFNVTFTIGEPIKAAV